MKIAGEMSRMCLVTHRPTSVEPATMVAPGSPVEHGGEIVGIGRHDQPRLARADLDARAVVQRLPALRVIALRSTASGSFAALP